MTIAAKTSLKSFRQAELPNNARSESPCVLSILKDPRLGGVLPGLLAVADGFELAQGAFQCCDGSGLRATSSGARVSCDLRARMRRLSILASRYHQKYCRVDNGSSWPGPVLEPAPRFLRATLERLAAIAKGDSAKGLMYQLPVKDAHRYSLWSVALMATWRFGFDVRILDLADTSALNDLNSSDRGVEAPSIVLIDQAGQLWDQQRADRFELAVGLAYRAAIPLWIAWQASSNTGPSAPTTTSHVGQAFAARLTRIKTKAPLEWLDASTRSKLHAVCELAKKANSSGTLRST